MSNITSEDSSPPPPVHHAPCAICQTLRQRCHRDCPFALHFPSQRPTCLDSLCVAYGARCMARMLLALSYEQWTPAANSLLYATILRLRNQEYATLQVITRLQNEVVDLQLRNAFLRNQLAVPQQPRQRQLSIYDLIQWPNNDRMGSMNEPPGG